jgi:uncharacterized protein YcbK (DUF882 family)
MTPLEFVERMMVLSCRFPFRVTSFYRDALHNAEVEGHAHSRHMFWLAMDVVLWTKGVKSTFILEAQRQGLKAVPESDHIHIQVP